MRRFMESAIHWIIASLIAAGIAWGLVMMHASENKPCTEKRCYVVLDKRLASIESEMKARTVDRYTGTDARRDLERLDKRIDALHGEVHKDKR